MSCTRFFIATGLLALVVGCASSGQMSAGGISRLERARAARPHDAAVARSLGIAYYKEGRFQDARTHLEQSVRLDPRDGAASLYLGLAAEQQQDLQAAKAAYQTYVQYGRTSRVRRQLEARLAAITRRELQEAARNAVAQEQQLATGQGSMYTVAVMPLRFVGPDSSLQPLERGMAELITTDLARSSRLTVVERARLQALLDEIVLQQGGLTDTSTNVRAGRIMQAGSIVSGQIVQDAERLRVDAAIVNTQTSAVTGGAANENTLEQLFAIQKAVVLQLFESLGIVLTTAERNAIEQRPTRSIQAFLAYSRGLRLEDEGRYDEASRSFGEAVRLDPGFMRAQQKTAQTQAVAQGMQLNAVNIEANLAGTQEESVARQAVQGNAPPAAGAGGGAGGVASGLNPSPAQGATNAAGAGGAGTTTTTAPPKDPIGQESGSKNANIIIIVKIPSPR